MPSTMTRILRQGRRVPWASDEDFAFRPQEKEQVDRIVAELGGWESNFTSTPRLLGGCLSALAALFGILVSRQSDLDDAAGVDWAVVCANLNVSVSVKA